MPNAPIVHTTKSMILVRGGEMDQGGEGALDQACLGVLHQNSEVNDFEYGDECPYIRSDLSFRPDDPI